ncbi:MAG: DUF2442 domain-containing protein [Chlorobiaceae bacterium]
MNYPKIKSAQAIDSHSLLVEFDNEQKRRYDINRLLDKEMFAPLRDESLFRAVKVDVGGYAVVWRSDIDISEHELWIHGDAVS